MSRADRENRIRKNIPVKSYFLGKMIGDFLEEQIDPAVNFLMSGDDENRRSILYERIVQLYLSEEVEDRPIIVVVSSCKENREMLDELEEAIESDKISRVRDFIKIDTDNPEYCLFKGMNATQIEQAIEQSGKAFGDKRDANNWNSSAFQGVCAILEKHNYKLTLNNLIKVFSSTQENIVSMLRAEGLTAEAEEVSKKGCSYIKSVLVKIRDSFPHISSKNGNISILDQVRKNQNDKRPAPCFCFVLPENNRAAFLEYLAKELSLIGVDNEPILVLDEIGLTTVEGKPGEFYNYLLMNSGKSLNLSGESCGALIPENNRKEFILAKTFIMMFVTGTAAEVELITIELGQYDKVVAEKNRGTARTAFFLIPHDVHAGNVMREVNDRARIEGKDLINLRANEAYLTYMGNACRVVGLRF